MIYSTSEGLRGAIYHVDPREVHCAFSTIRLEPKRSTSDIEAHKKENKTFSLVPRVFNLEEQKSFQ